MPLNNVELKKNEKRIYFANACDICKKEGVFLLDNICGDCIENHCTRGNTIRKSACLCLKDNIWNNKRETENQEIKLIPIASSRPNPEVKAVEFSKLKS